ncbi:MAG TPA: hypothetical protein DCG48_04430 [Rhodospirillaceae bacterium]|nr:hypothetical protein [Rhodospirillaceae bacterium]
MARLPQPPANAASDGDDYSVADTIGAAFRLENTIGSFLAREDSVDAEPVADYTPFEPDATGALPIAGYEGYADRFVHVQSPAETERLISQIDREGKDKAILRAAGGWGYAASFAAGMLDPLILIPVGGQIKVGAGVLKTGLQAARAGAIGATITEGALHATQETRTAEESVVAIGGATFLSGILGGVAGKYLTKPQFDDLSKRVEKDLAPPPDDVVDPWTPFESSVGARQADNTTIEDNTLVSALSLEKRLAFASPIMRVLNSPSNEVRKAAQVLAEVPVDLAKNADGIATPISVETRVKFHQAALNDAYTALDREFVKYATGNPDGGRLRATGIALADKVRKTGRRMTYNQFRAEVGRAMRRGDQSETPEVQAAAEYFRNRVFEPLKREAIEAGLLPEDVDVDTALSYLTRVYDTTKIVKERPTFKARITDWLMDRRDEVSRTKAEREADLSAALRRAETAGDAEVIGKIEARIDKMREDLSLAGLEDIELEDIADQIIDTILQTPDGRVPYQATRLNRGPLKERTFSIEDERIEDFLLSDIELVSEFYVRTIAPDVELAKAFGTPEIDGTIAKVNDDYTRTINKATSDRQRKKVDAQRRADIRDLEAMRDRLRGTFGSPADPYHPVIRAARGVRTLNYLRILGGVLISSMTDVARPVMTEGLWRSFKHGVVPLVTNLRSVRLAGHEAKLAGTALDMVMDTRALQLADLGDGYGRYSRIETGLQGMANTFSLVNMMSPWNAAMKQWSATIIGSRIIDTAKRVKAGKATKPDIKKLASSGINYGRAVAIADMFEKFGQSNGTVRIADTARWTDREAVEAFRGALQKDVDRTIITPGIGDRPLWMSNELGKVVGQFRSFAFASTQRMLISGLQRKDLATANGAALMLALGAGVYWSKTRLAGKEPSDNPRVWVAEAVDRSGITGWLFDLNGMVEKVSRGAIGANALTGGPTLSRYAVRNAVGSVLGPTFGLGEDAFRVAGAAATGELKRSDIRAARRLLPYQNLWYIRGLLNALEDETAEELELKGR